MSGAESAILIRPERCTGCHACEIACEREHDGAPRVHVISYDGLNFPAFCHHCNVAPCVSVCYRSALTYKNGRVRLEREKCTRCGLCEIACPFGVILMAPDSYPLKCDGCESREKDGKIPACAATCPSGAIQIKPVGLHIQETRHRAFRFIRPGGFGN